MVRTIAVTAGLLALALPAFAQDSLNCRQVGIWPGWGHEYALGLAIDSPRNLAFLAIHTNETLGNDPYWGVQVLDISNPAQPRRLSSSRHPDEIHSVAYSNNRLYVGGMADFVEVWDVSNPEEIELLGGLDQLGAFGMVVAGDYSYLASGWGLLIIDISDPRNPFEVARCTTPDFAFDVFFADGLAYVADAGFGLRIIDVGDPTAPVVIGSCELAGRPFKIAVANGYAYLTDDSFDEAYWHVVDVSDPTDPTLVVSVPERGGTYGVAVSEEDNLVYIGCGAWRRGLRIFDVSNPAAPVEVGYYQSGEHRPLFANDITLGGRMAFSADWGLRIIEFLGSGVEEPPDKRPTFTQRGPTVVRGSLGLPQMTNDQFPMTLLDAAGRKVLALQPGENDVRHLAPGVYFVRTEGARGRFDGSSRKVVIQR